MGEKVDCVKVSRFIACIFLWILFFTIVWINMPAHAQEEAKDLRILVDGMEIREIPPIRVKDQLYLPVEPIAIALRIAVSIGEKAIIVSGRSFPAEVILARDLHYIPRTVLQDALGVRAYVIRDECAVHVMSSWYEYKYITQGTGKSKAQSESAKTPQDGSKKNSPGGGAVPGRGLEIVSHRIYGDFSANQNICVDVTVQNNTSEPKQNVTVVFQIVGIRDRNTYEKKSINYYGKIDETIPPGSRRSGKITLSMRNLANYQASGPASGMMTIDVIGQDYQQTHEYQILIEG